MLPNRFTNEQAMVVTDDGAQASTNITKKSIWKLNDTKIIEENIFRFLFQFINLRNFLSEIKSNCG